MITKVITANSVGNMNVVPNFITIHLIVVETSLRNTNVSLLVELEEKSSDQSQ